MNEQKLPPWQNKVEDITKRFNELMNSLNSYHEREQLINQLDRKILQTTSSSDEVYELVLEKGTELIGAKYAHILQIEQDQLRIVASKDKLVLNRTYPLSTGLVGKAIEQKAIINVANAANELGYKEIHPDTKGELIIPLQDSSGNKILGVFNLEIPEERQFTPEEVDHCKLLAGQIAIAIGQTKLWKGIELIDNFNAALLSGEQSAYEIYKKLLDDILQILDFRFGQIMLLDTDKKHLTVVADSTNGNYVNSTLDPDNSICGRYVIFEKGRTPLVLNDISSSPYVEFYRNLSGEPGGAVSELVVPLIHGDQDNDLVGLINIEDSRKNVFTDFDTRIISILAKRMAESIAAGRFRLGKKKREKAELNSLILTQMGTIAIDHLHKIGGKINGVKGDLNYLLQSASSQKIDFPKFKNRDGIQYIKDMVEELQEVHELTTQLQKDFNPDRMDRERKRINLIDEIQITLEKKYQNLVASAAVRMEYDANVKKEMICELTAQFQQVIEALVNNAIEATEDEKRLITIKVDFKKEDLLKAQINIIDNGSGIPEENREQIFNHGFSTKKHKRGQGLGMWFIRYYIEYFYGTVEVIPTDSSEGTNIEIVLPIFF
ncbi:MAG TPA: GAF domain-containing protein [Haliscomenobacter sp.]|uniref:GAF domain-containing protein n=1 Tax=Haliscomenobacter sp. TaxID=2717303 RepID=UPI002C4FC4AA|nr:GAF domain-containing protein [Haliscomenobacter sp.]HOY16823.1 GAF domain-containing protein [Haliscomenobacter sp.]